MAGWWVYDGAAWKQITQPKIYIGGGIWRDIVRGMVYDGTAWKRFWPETEVTVTAISSGLTGTIPVGVSRVITGTVTAVSGSISGGTVTVYQRLVGATTWTAIGSATAGTGAIAPWSVNATPSICGATEFKASYGGNGTYQPSDSAVTAATVIVSTPTKPTGGTIANTTASFSWTAVAGATSYDVYRNGVLKASQTGLTYNDTGLSPNTDYSWTVRATRGTCVSTVSPALTGHTGQAAVTDAGSATISIRPDKTNSYRPDVAWGYIGENIGQGYYSESNRNYTGTIDYGGQAALQAACIAALGANGATRYANMTVSAARVFLFKKTGVGTSGTVTVTFYNSPATAGTGGAPARNGTATTDTSSSAGTGKYCSIGTAHWAALKAGTARSIVLYNPTSAVYAQFDGKSGGTDRGNLQLDCSWSYQLTSAVTPGWTN